MSTTERAQSDFKKLKSKYNSQLSTLKELFTEWTEEDLLFTLQDADGDLELAIDRISEGHASQWGEVKTKKSKKEAAAANKATLEVSASSTTSTAPSYPPSSYNNTRAPSNRTSTNTKRPSPAVSQPRHKSTSATWQQSTKKTTTDDNHNWKPTDNWSSNDSWSTQTKDPIVETPKKISTPSSSTKTSNGGGAKTWASLLQSKPEPVAVAEPVEEPQLQKVDDSWLPSSSSDLNQWDQPLQLPTTENVQEQVQKEVKKENPTTEKEQSPIITHTTITAATTITPTTTTTTTTKIIEKDQDIPVDFSSLTLQDNIVENTSSSHPSVADLLNSVKQQPSTSNTTATSSTTTQPIDSLTQQQLYQQQQQQLYQQQQQYQQFGVQDYGHSFNSGYGASTNYYAQEEKVPDVSAAATSNISSTGQQYPQQSVYGQPPQQSFYPYYYMPNQFNAYSPYGQQQGTNSFASSTRSNMYPTSVYGQQKTTASSPYLNSSPYNQTQQLYSGFNQFDQFYNNSPQATTATTTTATHESPDKTTKSPQNPSHQAYSSNYFAQSPMFGYQQQQQQSYRGTGNTNQYWNQ